MKTKKLRLILMAVMMVMLLPVTSLASSISHADARDYLVNYRETVINENGEEITRRYSFNSDEDIDILADYIVDHGFDAFNEAIETAINIKNAETQSSLPVVEPRSVNPLTIYKTISGNGRHDISDEAGGITEFDKLSDEEYIAVLEYRLDVENGKIVELSDISFDVTDLSYECSYTNTSFPSYFNDNNAGVTANFTIVKTVQITIDPLLPPVVLIEEDPESFAILVTLQ